MASKSGMFLEEEERRRLIRQLQFHDNKLQHNNNMTRLASIAASSSNSASGGNDTGCLICGNDDDHNNLMLCEGCNDEYHIYCLDPPLTAVPHDDWYCDNCIAKSRMETKTIKDDGLNDLVTALPREFTSRFGEVCFANGGFGFGWWPSCIFDPRLTEGGARQTAKKNLGKKHLIYFFECHETPFAVLTSSKIVKWHEGLAENHHLGKTARAAGKQRTLQFQQALQAAIIEEDKPLRMRLDWNSHHRFEEQPQLLPLPNKKPNIQGPSDIAVHLSPTKQSSSKEKRRRHHHESSSKKSKKKKHKDGDEPLYCKVMKRKGTKSYNNIGFVKVASCKKSTFLDVRNAIQEDLVPDGLPEGTSFKFNVSTLGPVSGKQESSLGPVIPFLRSGSGGSLMNAGSIADPIPVYIFEVGGKH